MSFEALAATIGSDSVVAGSLAAYLSDETETRNLTGSCSAVVTPASAEEVAGIVRWAYEYEVPLVPRGGGTGYAGGAVPSEGSVVVSLERLTRIRHFDPLLWRVEVEAGVTTDAVRRLARESGLYYPPDPGAGEQSQIGGNIATNAGGPHAFKYGTTGAWVTGIEAVIPPGELVSFGGPIRKDVASYDLKRLLTGSEGTLGIITAAWLRLIPSPESSRVAIACYASAADGVVAIESLLGSGLDLSILEYADAGAVAAAPPSFFEQRPSEAGFVVMCEAQGASAEVDSILADAIEVLADRALAVCVPTGRDETTAVWRWRESMTSAVTTKRGGKISEDIVVPVDRLAEAIERTQVIGAEFGLPACSWGHAGDGNLHSTFLIDRSKPDELSAGEKAAERLFSLAVELGGSISGEHGLGLVKSGQLAGMLSPSALALHRGVKSLFDPKGLLNPGKKC